MAAFRDRQTLVYALVLPVVLYPAIFWALIQGATVIQGLDEATRVRVEVAGDAPPHWITSLQAAAEGEELELTITAGPLNAAQAASHLHSNSDSEPARSRPSQDAVLVLGTENSELFYDATRSSSRLAAERVRKRVEELASELRDAAVRAEQREPESLVPFRLQTANVAGQRDLGAYLLSFILPMTFVIMAVLGALYPAVDLTAGEKERGTAETTLLLPVPRLGVQLGKILAVATAAALATTLNLGGMALAAENLLAGFRGLDIEVPWLELLIALPFCAAFLFGTSAILLAAASTTQTFKQGQSLLGIVQTLFMLPAVVAVMPGRELSQQTALVPVVQTAQAFKAILQGAATSPADPQRPLLLVVFVAQLVYALLAVALCVRLAGREKVALPARLSARRRSPLTGWLSRKGNTQ